MNTSPRVVQLHGYAITIEPGAIERIGNIVRSAAPAFRYAIITDANVGPLYASRVAQAIGADARDVLTIEAGEAHKSRETWASVTDTLLAAGHARDSAIVALGGGVVGDLAGFVAATFMRGIPYVQIPTTLLAMIDASVGGKTGVDTAAGKNLVGAFHQPAAVIADPDLLASLPRNHLRAGLAEAIKHGVIADDTYFDRVAAFAGAIDADGSVLVPDVVDLVARSVEIKADVVRRDAHEGGVRKTLNFGHTIGHAIELCSGFQLLHGETIAIGMIYETLIAERLGVAEPGTAARIRDAVRAAGLPERRPETIAIEDVIHAARGDKKARGGRVEYALPARIGAMAGAAQGWAIAVDESLVREVLA